MIGFGLSLRLRLPVPSCLSGLSWSGMWRTGMYSFRWSAGLSGCRPGTGGATFRWSDLGCILRASCSGNESRCKDNLKCRIKMMFSCRLLTLCCPSCSVDYYEKEQDGQESGRFFRNIEWRRRHRHGVFTSFSPSVWHFIKAINARDKPHHSKFPKTHKGENRMKPYFYQEA